MKNEIINYPPRRSETGHRFRRSYNLQSYQLYPNPTSGRLSIEAVAADTNPVKAEMYNAIGSLVISTTLDLSQKVANLQMGNVAPGLYILKLTDANGKIVHFKFVVE